MSYLRYVETAGLPSLESFIKSPMRNGYIKFKDLEAYYKKGVAYVNGTIYKNVLIRGNTTNKKGNRGNNIKTKTKHKSTGQYRELDNLTYALAKQYGFDGVYVEQVMNEFLPAKLEQYGYIKAGEDYGGTPSYFKKVE